MIKTVSEFNISNLSWDTVYCISVEPNVASRPTRTTRTDEQCVTIGERDSEWRGSLGRGILAGRGSSSASWPWGDRSVPPLPSLGALCTNSLPFPPHLGTSSLAGSTELVLSIGSSFVITLLLLGLLGALLVCTYLKKPVRPPSVLVRQLGAGHPLCRCEGAGLGSCWGRLTTSRDKALLTPLFPYQKSFIKQSSLWMEESSSSSGSHDADSVQQLFLCQKEPQQTIGPNSSTSTGLLPLEEAWRLPAWPEDWLCLLGSPGSGDSSCTSTDSGICLHTSSSSELSCSSGPQSHGYKQQLPTSDDSGVGLETTCPRPTCSSSHGNASPGEARQPCGEELGHSPAASQDCQQDLEFRGYLQQSKGTVEPRQDPTPGACAGSLQGPGSADIMLDVECSELAVAKGYLKQSPPEHPRNHAQDLTTQQEPSAWDFSNLLGPRAPTLPSYGAPAAPFTSKTGPEVLKAPFDPSIFNTDLLGTLPLISSLGTDKWLTPQVNPLSLLNGDSKDSRL